MINATQLESKLQNVPEGSIIFVSYIPGRPPTSRAISEARRAIVEEGIAPRHFTGALKALWKTKKGQTVLTLWVNERDSVSRDGAGMTEGAYRAFNPSLGRLLSVEVIQRAAPKAPVATV